MYNLVDGAGHVYVSGAMHIEVCVCGGGGVGGGGGGGEGRGGGKEGRSRWAPNLKQKNRETVQ